MDDELLFYWRVFNELATERQMGFGGAGPIPWSSINAYADRMGLDEDETECLHAILRLVDNDYLKMIAPKKDPDSKYRARASFKDPKAVGRLLDGFERRRKARESRKR